MTTCNALGKQVWQSRTCSYSARTFQRLDNTAYTVCKADRFTLKETSPKTAFRKSLKTRLFQDWNFIIHQRQTTSVSLFLCAPKLTTFPHSSHPTPTSPFLCTKSVYFFTSWDIVWTRDASLKHHHHYHCRHHHLHHSNSSWTHIPYPSFWEISNGTAGYNYRQAPALANYI